MQINRVPERRPIDKVELLGDHAPVSIELTIHERGELRGKIPVVIRQLLPPRVPGEAAQLAEAGIRIQAINMKMVVFERCEIATSAAQLISAKDRAGIH